ncbi:MAG: aspartate kinase [Armatimonadota bacterium]|nr:aspartate kinase [Armatimonadota bacterium]MCX7776992.1 aspartate kinase [Armatimonadota bacterium]MDW8024826.1 aspartate kinase [Armatimonadota bacterium]
MPSHSERVIVQKFGGTSVYPMENLLSSARCVIRAIHQGWIPVVVVSAPGRKGDPYATDTLKKLAEDINPQVPVKPRELDLLMTCGEIISIVLMAQAIRVLGGYDTIALTGGQAGIYTDYEFGNAAILEIDTRYIRRCLREGKIPIVAGFQGVTKRISEGEYVHGAITTLGRGGSDTTATALGKALGAQLVEIYTDVDGVMTADPKIVGGRAKRHESLAYEELSELAHLGARVVHPRAVEIAHESMTPIFVRSTEATSVGTRVDKPLKELGDGFHRITGITQSAPVVHFKIEVERESDLPEVEMLVYRALGDCKISVHFNVRFRRGFEFVINRDAMAQALQVLDGLPIKVSGGGRKRIYVLSANSSGDTFSVKLCMLRESLKHAEEQPELKVTRMEVGANKVTVSIVAPNVREHPEVLARALEALLRAKIEVFQVSDADHSLSFLVYEEDAVKAVSVLHHEFFERAQ